MTTLIEKLDSRFYPNHPRGWDDSIFRNIICSRLTQTDTLLDFGAGRGANPRLSFQSEAAKICGVDLADEVFENPYLDEAKLLENGKIPYPENTFDLIISSYVLEHLEDPVSVFQELLRVLKPGGFFVARTPNKYHYVPIIAATTPHRFHEYINKKRGRKEEDTFPTYYRANSKGQIYRLANESGFEVDAIELFDGRPEYMRFNVFTYSVGYLYERIANSTEALAWMRPLLIVTLQKPKR
jgi:SAM-dependent methyltransferase